MRQGAADTAGAANFFLLTYYSLSVLDLKVLRATKLLAYFGKLREIVAATLARCRKRALKRPQEPCK
jgi:hypothetical protein